MSRNPEDRGQPQTPFAALRRFVRSRAVLEHCEMCSVELASEHQHLIEPLSRQLACACDACAILFDGDVAKKYKRVPRRIRFLPDFQITDGQWDDLRLPIQLAFFFECTPEAKVVAMYPSPAGPTESLLSLDAWDEIVRENPILKKMEADTEALLVSRVGERHDYYIVPVDECYRLVGLIRAHWRGLSGGTEVWREILKFFASLQERSVTVSERASV